MRRLFKWDKKYLYWGVTAFCVVAASIVFYMLLRYIPTIGAFLGRLGRILSPFIWGFVITYLLLPLLKRLERFFRKHSKKQKSRWPRTVAIIICEIVFLALLAALVMLVIPQLYSSVEMLVNNSTTYAERLTDWAEKLLADYPMIEEYVTRFFGNINESIINFVKTSVLPSVGSFVANLTTGVYYVLRSLYNLIIGIIVSAYLLSNYEKAGAWARKILYSIFTIEAAEKIRDGVAFVDDTFMSFLSGKLLDSLIIAIICYITCAILGMPYALLLSAIVGVTNIIPFFGPVIGAVPCTIIVLMINPFKALIFAIFCVILQQIDGNIIGPKILGNSVGINGFWIMFSIILGAGLFGFWGMVLGVPVWVSIYTLVCTMIDKKLKRSDLPMDAEAYEHLDYIDPATREVHRKKEAVTQPAGRKQTERKAGADAKAGNSSAPAKENQR